MSWFWINIPLMAMFFIAMTGIPLWLVFRHPDGPEPARAHQGHALPAPVAGQYVAATHRQTAPMLPVKLSTARGDDEFALAELAGARR